MKIKLIAAFIALALLMLGSPLDTEAHGRGKYKRGYRAGYRDGIRQSSRAHRYYAPRPVYRGYRYAHPPGRAYGYRSRVGPGRVWVPAQRVRGQRGIRAQATICGAN